MSVQVSSQDWTEARDLRQLLERVSPLTMVAEDSLIDLARQVRTVLSNGIAGDLVECGVWRGGAAFLMADVLRAAGVADRKVWMFDSFEGLPPPKEVDGEAAMAFARDRDSPWYLDNCRASVEEVRQNAVALGLAAHTEIVKGWFDRTLPTQRARIGPIAILRIDSDWHASVRCCLDNLYEQVVDGGLVVIGDYYTYDGCALAVHEFFAERRLSDRIESAAATDGSPHHGAAVFRKGGASWRWMHQLYLAGQEISSFAPPGEAFILVDGYELTLAVDGQRRAIRFFDGSERRWELPADDRLVAYNLRS